MAAQKIRENRLKFLGERPRLTQEEIANLTELDMTTGSRHENAGRGLGRDDLVANTKVYKCQTGEMFIDPAEPIKIK